MSDAAPALTDPLGAAEIGAARGRIAGAVVRTPLVAMADGRTWLKLECLQPVGSYKVRGAVNALEARLESGEAIESIVTASAGNFGQALAWAAKALALPITIHVPDHAARVKVDNLRRLGAAVREHDFAAWWRIMETRDS